MDSKNNLDEIASALNEIAEKIPILFPVHPRTLKNIQTHKIKMSDRIVKIPPLSFKEALLLSQLSGFDRSLGKRKKHAEIT